MLNQPMIWNSNMFQALAVLLGDTYVRTTRFAEISSGTSGTVTLPPNSEVVLDDFGGDTDAVITTIASGRPTFQSAVDVTNTVIATTFDTSGNYVLTGTPSSYPVAIVYRVRQRLKDFDSTSTDIIGDFSVDHYVNKSGDTMTGTLVVPTLRAQSSAGLQLQNSGGTTILDLGAGGGVNATLTAPLNVTGAIAQTGNTDSVQLRVRGNATQTANLQEWQNSAGAVLARIDSTGAMISDSLFRLTHTATSRTAGELTKSGDDGILNLYRDGLLDTQIQGNGSSFLGSLSGGNVSIGSSSNIAKLGIFSTNTSTVSLAVRAFASQTSDLTQWQNSAGTVLSSVNSLGNFLASVSPSATGYGFIGASNTGIYAPTTITLGAIAGATEVWRILSSGVLNVATRISIGAGLTGGAGNTNFLVRSTSASNVASTIQGTSSQTGDLTQWMDIASTVLGSIDSAGRHQAPAGSAGAPSYAFQGFGNNGMFRPTTDTVAFSTASSERMRIGSTGLVGIGTTSTPDAQLHVTRSSSGSITDCLVLQNPNSAGGTGVRLIMASTSAIAPNQNGRIDFVGTRMAGDDSMDLSIALSPGLNGTPLTRFYLDGSTGNVGIGTTSPQTSLHVVGTAIRGESSSTDATAKSFDIVQGHHTNAQAPFSLFTTISNATQSIVWIGGGSGSYNSATDVRIFTGASNTTLTGTERLRVTSTGNVGIGTTSPQGRLDVSAGGATQTAGDLVVDTANNLVYVGRLDSVSGNTNFIFRDRLGQVKSRWENAGSGSIGFGNFSDGFGIRVSRSPTALASAIGNIGALFFVNASDAPTSFPTVIIRAHGAQTTDQLQFQNSAGTTLSSIGSDGRVNIRSDYASGVATLIDFAGNRATLKIDASANFEWETSSARNTVIRSGAVTTAFFGSNLTGNNVTIGATANLAKLAVVNTVASTVAQAVLGAASQTADLTQWQNSGGTVLTAVQSNGRVNFASGNTATTATAGAQTLPANPEGFIIIQVGGVDKKIPYYAN